MATFLFAGRVTTDSVNNLIIGISTALNKGAKEVTVLMSSRGGEIYPSISFNEFAVKNFHSRNVRCINIGDVYSSCSILFLSFEKGNRFNIPGTSFMVHSVKNGTDDIEKQKHISDFNDKQISILGATTLLDQHHNINNIFGSGNDFYVEGDDIKTWGFAEPIESYTITSSTIHVYG
jgi:ATP-dependent protease ClpP protease subunit